MQVDHNKAVVDGLELFKQSKWHKDYTVKDVYRYLIAPLKYNRIRLYYQDRKPIGLVTWCWLSKEDGQKFLDNNYYITENDYVSDEGAELWGIELLAPYGNARQVFNLIRKEHTSIYGRDEKVNWRRLHEPNKRHTREFKK
tara:strand:+ start:49 stop:471 length:423 start_codon:yes stop_codon:yes gene_type:complete